MEKSTLIFFYLTKWSENINIIIIIRNSWILPCVCKTIRFLKYGIEVLKQREKRGISRTWEC